MFGEIERSTVAQTIVNRFKILIQQGHLQPGQKLPSERELCNRLNVGRSSVREATSAMLAMGLIEIRPGEGVFIRQDFPHSLLESIDWSTIAASQIAEDLHEARMVIEANTARLAALRAVEEDKVDIERIVDRMRYAATLDELIEQDVAFHMALACASKNVVLRSIVAGMRDLMRRSMYNTLQQEPIRQLAFSQHEMLLQAIKGGEAEKAEKIMRAHLEKDKSVAQVLSEKITIQSIPQEDL